MNGEYYGSVFLPVVQKSVCKPSQMIMGAVSE